MGFWLALGRGIGKGIGWLIRHPEAIDLGVKAIKSRKKKAELPEDGELPSVGNSDTEPTK